MAINDADMLLLVAEYGPCSAADLMVVNRHHWSETTCRARLNRLEKLGCVERVKEAGNKYSYVLADEGMRWLEKILEDARESELGALNYRMYVDIVLARAHRARKEMER